MNLHSFGHLAAQFPNPATAPADGLLAYGGSLSPSYLLAAYSKGIFPWYSENSPILWWSPDPRCVLIPDKFHLPRRSKRKIARLGYQITMDFAFERVIRACAEPRPEQSGTWITADILHAYVKLHELGYAHSIETWFNGRLVGGLYGVSMGKAFFGESMFHYMDEASRAALAALIKFLKIKGFEILDCQQTTPHMLAMGAEAMPRKEFLAALAAILEKSRAISMAGLACPWTGWTVKHIYSEDDSGWKKITDYPFIPADEP